MNKRKHPNFIDIIFILLILAVAAAAYFISHQDSGTADQLVGCTYTIELTELNPGADALIEVGDSVVDNVRNYEMGTVTKVEVVPCTMSALDQEKGVIRQAEVPGKINLLVTVQADTLQTESSITTASGYTLRVGTDVSCTVGGLYGTGLIISIVR